MQEAEEEEHEEEQVMNIEIPRTKADLGKEIHFVKLPNFLDVSVHKARFHQLRRLVWSDMHDVPAILVAQT
jgi:hypothetical protein